MAFLDLPPELLIRVSSYLTTPELGNLRRSCKHVESNLFDTFAREFFTKKQFMIEQISLQALVDIANHPTLSLRLSEVVIGLQTFYPDPALFTPLSKMIYQAGHVSQDVLLASGQALNMLSEAFSKLPNLRTVGLRDYNARGRYRDGESAAWRSWGWSFNNPDTASNFMPNCPPQAIFPLLLYALGCSQSKPESIHVFLRRRPKLTAISFNILEGFMGEKVKPVLQSVKEIMLAIDNENPSGSDGNLRYHDADHTADAPLERMLYHMPALETLRLNFEPHQYIGSRVLSWLGQSVPSAPHTYPSKIPSITPISFPNLRSLELGTCSASAAVLLKVLTKFDLVSFSLWKCILHTPHRASRANCWSDFLDEFSSSLPQATRLKSFLIGYPSQKYLDDTFELETDVYFKPSGDDEDDSNRGLWVREIRHRAGPGTDIKAWIKSLSERVVLEPEADSEMETSEDDDGEDDEEDGGEDEDEGEDGDEDDG